MVGIVRWVYSARLLGTSSRRCVQVQNGGKVFAKRTGSKTQIGRWKGLDEDVSDDQVSHTMKRACDCSFQVQGFKSFPSYVILHQRVSAAGITHWGLMSGPGCFWTHLWPGFSYPLHACPWCLSTQRHRMLTRLISRFLCAAARHHPWPRHGGRPLPGLRCWRRWHPQRHPELRGVPVPGTAQHEQHRGRLLHLPSLP